MRRPWAGPPGRTAGLGDRVGATAGMALSGVWVSRLPPAALVAGSGAARTVAALTLG